MLTPLHELYLAFPELDWAALERYDGPWPTHRLLRLSVDGGELLVNRIVDGSRLMMVVFAADGRFIHAGWRNTDMRIPVALFVASYLLPRWLALAARLAGRLLLHGNAVCVDGQMIAWIGDKGAGKSTLAAAFMAAGHTLLADDHLLIWPHRDSFAIAPGVRRLHLWPASLQVVSDSAGLLWQQPLGEGSKGYLQGPAHQEPDGLAAAVPLHTIHVLQSRAAGAAALRRTAVGRARGLQLLLTHCFGRGDLPLDRRQQATEMASAGALLQRVSLQSLQLPDALHALPDVVRELCGLAKGPLNEAAREGSALQR